MPCYAKSLPQQCKVYVPVQVGRKENGEQKEASVISGRAAAVVTKPWSIFKLCKSGGVFYIIYRTWRAKKDGIHEHRSFKAGNLDGVAW